MGCSICSGARVIKRREPNYQEEITEIYDLGSLRDVIHIQKIWLKINNIHYQIVKVNEYFPVICQSNYSQNQFHQKILVINHSQISSQQQTKQQIKQSKQIKQTNTEKLSLINQKKDLFLFSNKDQISLKSLKRHKIIVQLKIGKAQISLINFNQHNTRIIYLQQEQNIQQFICVLNILNRKVIRQPFNQQLKQIISLPKTDEFLSYINGIGIVLNKINYENKKIEKVKILSYDFNFSVCIFDDYNQIDLISREFYIKFDKNYNIFQKYKINFDTRQYIPGTKSTHLKQYLIDKRKQKQFISEFYNYQIEYLFTNGRLQHLISQNERYLAYIIQDSLIFHIVQQKYDQQIKFNDNIAFLNFSTNSQYLFAVQPDKIYCYRTEQNLKKCSSYHAKITEQNAMLNSIILTINGRGDVKMLSRQSNKLIFKFKTIKEYSSFDYNQKLQIILASSNQEIFLYNIVVRKQIIKQNLENKQCKMIGDTNQLFILSKQLQLQLWSLQNNNINLQRIIMHGVEVILQGYSINQCIRTSECIIILDQEFNIIEQIYYQKDHSFQQRYNFPILLDKWDQVIQEKLILKFKYQLQSFTLFGEPKQNIVLKLEKRNIKKQYNEYL